MRSLPEAGDEVSNGLARQVLAELRKLVKSNTERSNFVYDPASALQREELALLRARLRDSGLAGALAAGPDMLPDPGQGSGWLLAHFFRFVRPRNYRQLLRQVALNLKWYLRPEQRAPVPLSFYFALLGGVYVLLNLLLFGLVGLGYSSAAGLPLGMGMLGLGTAVLAIGGMGYVYLRRDRECLNLHALYEYLLEAYGDAPDEQYQRARLAAGLRSTDLASKCEADKQPSLREEQQ